MDVGKRKANGGWVKVVFSFVGSIIAALLPEISETLRALLIEVLKKLQEAAKSTKNTFDDTLVQLLMDIFGVE